MVGLEREGPSNKHRGAAKRAAVVGFAKFRRAVEVGRIRKVGGATIDGDASLTRERSVWGITLTSDSIID